MNKIIRWGILGTGTIANTFARDLLLVEDGILQGVASRDLEKAKAFGSQYGAVSCYGSYEELVQDPDIDAVYIATPHVFHKENSMLCLRAKKAVLCEKPMAINALEAKEMIDCARENEVFLMEAMWTRFLPHIKWVRELIEKGEIGQIKWIKADFGFGLNEDYPESGRLLNKTLAGGSLLDVGIYPISFVNMIMKREPIKKSTSLFMGSTGVDLSFVGHFIYDDGAVATMFSSVNVNSEQEVHIAGTKGSVYLPNCWFGDEAIVTYENGEKCHRKMPKKGKGYTYEIEEVNKLLKAGRLESENISLNESLRIMEFVDEIARKQ